MKGLQREDRQQMNNEKQGVGPRGREEERRHQLNTQLEELRRRRRGTGDELVVRQVSAFDAMVTKCACGAVVTVIMAEGFTATADFAQFGGRSLTLWPHNCPTARPRERGVQLQDLVTRDRPGASGP